MLSDRSVWFTGGMTINPVLPTLDREQWLHARHTLGHLPVHSSTSERVAALFGPCPPAPRPPFPVHAQQNAGGFSISLFHSGGPARLSVSAGPSERAATSMSAADCRNLAAALNRAAYWLDENQSAHRDPLPF